MRKSPIVHPKQGEPRLAGTGRARPIRLLLVWPAKAEQEPQRKFVAAFKTPEAATARLDHYRGKFGPSVAFRIETKKGELISYICRIPPKLELVEDKKAA